MPAVARRLERRAQLGLRGREADRVDRRPDRPAREHARRRLRAGRGPSARRRGGRRARRRASRKPTRPASTASASPSRSTSSRASYSAGSPWVCGHQRGGARDLERPLGHGVARRPRAARASPRAALIGPAELDLDRASARRSSSARRRAPHRQHARRRPPGAGAAAARRRRGRGGARATPGARARPAPGRGRSPGARPSSVVRKKRRFWFATTRVRQRARGRRRSREQRGERPAADRELVVVPQQRADVDRVGGEHRPALEHELAVEEARRRRSRSRRGGAGPPRRRRPARRRTRSETTSPRRRGRARRVDRPASASAAAAVPGTRAGCQSSQSSFVGVGAAGGRRLPALGQLDRGVALDTRSPPGAPGHRSGDGRVERGHRLLPRLGQRRDDRLRVELPAPGEPQREHLRARRRSVPAPPRPSRPRRRAASRRARR